MVWLDWIVFILKIVNFFFALTPLCTTFSLFFTHRYNWHSRRSLQLIRHKNRKFVIFTMRALFYIYFVFFFTNKAFTGGNLLSLQILASVALVWLEMQPLSLTDAAQTPRFALFTALLAAGCASSWSTSFGPQVCVLFVMEWWWWWWWWWGGSFFYITPPDQQNALHRDSALLRLWCLQHASAQRGWQGDCRLAVLREPCLPVWRHVFQPRFVSLFEHRLPV